MKSALVIGGGFAGCAAAHQLALAGGWNVTLVEAGSQLGAGVRTQWMGGHPYTFGPRHVVTKNEAVWAFLNEYVPLRRCNEHEFISYVEKDKQFYTYPIHEDDISRMPDSKTINEELSCRNEDSIAGAQNFEQFWRCSIGPSLYDKFINTYSKKMWGVDDNAKIDTFSWSPKGVTIKSGPRAGWDAAISGYPIAPNGYDNYFDIATTEATVLLNTKLKFYEISRKSVKIGDEWHHFDIIINTISPDDLFDNVFGRLKYMGRDLTTLVLPVKYALPENVYFCYYTNREPYTRVTEYKKFTRHHDPSSTLISVEYPSAKGRLYPMPFKSEQAKARRYFDLMPDGVFSIGRAGSYDYSVDIDDCIAQAMEIRNRL